MNSSVYASKSKVVLSLLLSFVLITGLLPYSAAEAFADEVNDASSSSVGDTAVADAESEASDLDAVVEDSVDEATKQSPDNNVAALSDDEDVEIVEDTSAFNFIYVDTKTVALGETQSVAIDFVQPENAATSKLWYQHDDGELESVGPSNTADGAALYQWTFEGNEDLGTYNLVKVSWGSEEDGTAGEAAINSDTELGYSFAVVEYIPEDADEDGVSVYALDEDGELNEADNLSDALQEAEESLDSADNTSSASSSSEGGILSSLSSAVGVRKAYAATSITIALDPGHGGSDSGATHGSLVEKTLNLKIAKYCKSKLDKQSGIKTFMTRSDDTYVGLEDRVKKAVAAGAQIFVSFHINETAGATGFEVWIQNDSSWNYSLHTQSSELGTTILNKLSKLGLKNRGNKESDSSSAKYADGSAADKLSVLRTSRQNNIPAVLIEHGFIDGASSDQKLLSSESGLKSMGEADADAIIEYCNKHKSDFGIVSDSYVNYQTHVQDYGWQDTIVDGSTSGTTGKSKRLEGIKISLGNLSTYSGSIQYKTHVQDYGWQDWASDGAMSGTTGKSKRLEAIQVKLTGQMANQYDVYYRVHAQDYGWLGWAKNGESAGTSGMSKRLEAIQIKLVKKGSAAPGSTDGAYQSAQVRYRTHVQDKGWQPTVWDGATSGTTGKSKRLEGITISLNEAAYSGSIQYKTHVQDYGWQDWASDGAVSGTTGKSKRLEAIQIKLTGQMANQYDVYYRVHAQDYGWLGWAKNGESAGTEGFSKRLEGIQIKLVKKGASAPGSTDGAFISNHNIMGSSAAAVSQMVSYYTAMKKAYPSVYASKGAATIKDFCQIIYDEAKAEGVRAEVVFCQAMHETGWLQFTGDVKAEQCNFGGLGATGGGAAGATFDSVRTGIRAQVQHLKAYASTDSLNKTCVDPRFKYVKRGCATTVEDLNGKWAVPGTDYGQNIYTLMQKLLTY